MSIWAIPQAAAPLIQWSASLRLAETRRLAVLLAKMTMVIFLKRALLFMTLTPMTWFHAAQAKQARYLFSSRQIANAASCPFMVHHPLHSQRPHIKIWSPPVVLCILKASPFIPLRALTCIKRRLTLRQMKASWLYLTPVMPILSQRRALPYKIFQAAPTSLLPIAKKP